MRLGKMIAVAAAAMMGSISPQAASYGLPRFMGQLPPLPGEPEMTTVRSTRATRVQRHTGAGAAGMHRAWKRRRASGRA